LNKAKKKMLAPGSGSLNNVESDCVHRLCKKGKPDEEPCWFPGGLPLTYVPVPTPELERPFGNPSCSHCKEFCSGHYTKPEKLWQHIADGGALSKASPPSCIIVDAYTKEKAIPSEDTIQEIAKNVQLPIAEVVMWLEHLQQICVNRKKVD